MKLIIHVYSFPFFTGRPVDNSLRFQAYTQPRLFRTYFDPATWQNGCRFRRAEPGALPRLPGALRRMPGAGFPATLSNFENLQITSLCSSLLRLHAVEVRKKGMKQEFQLKKKYRKSLRDPQLAADTLHA